MKTFNVAGAAVLAFIAGGAPHSPAADSQWLKHEHRLTRSAVVSIVSDPRITTDQGLAGDARAAANLGAITESGELAFGQRARDDNASQTLARRHFDRDLEAMRLYRPGYRVWRHVFTVPNGRMAFGSASDGTLLATFPLGENWAQGAQWVESSLSDSLAGQPLAGMLAERRDDTAKLLTKAVGPVVYNATRGSFIAEGTQRYGSFLKEWGAIFERFGVPAEVGLAQALVESGLRGRIRSGAQAVGFCQWLPRNWARLQALSPSVIEADNQTTQVPYCAAHLAILATKYGSLIPALSEHHAGGLNVGRTIINGDFAGGGDVRARYFLGAELTLLLRQIRPPGFREVAGSYGPRSFRYAEMVFGNLGTIEELESAMPQEQIFAMRPDRAIPFDEVASRTGLPAEEIRRFNPALIKRVPAGANLYLPFHVEDFGRDTAFWHRPPTPDYLQALSVFLRLDQRFGAESWRDGSAFDELHAFETRFLATATEEGAVMAAVIAYLIEELSDGRQMEILTEFPRSERAHSVLTQGVHQMQVLLHAVEDKDGRAPGNAFPTTASLSMR